jgi:hypothetical protein
MVSFYFDKKRNIANGKLVSCLAIRILLIAGLLFRFGNCWHRYWRIIVRTIGKRINEKLWLENWHVSICWYHANMYPIRSYYETVEAKKGSCSQERECRVSRENMLY